MSTHVANWLLRVLLCITLAVSFVVVLPDNPAEAASPSCKGNSCYKRDPQYTNCVNDARTIQSRVAVTNVGNWGVLEMRYSPYCQSNWARYTAWCGAAATIGSLTGGLTDGYPLIRQGGGPYAWVGEVNRSSPARWCQTSWTGMVTSAGSTCTAVNLFYTEPSSSGQGGRRSLGTYLAPCIS